MSWNSSIYVGHVAVEGLTTAGGIQGNSADALLDILSSHDIQHVFKWVDDVVIFRIPIQPFDPSSGATPSFNFDLSKIFHISDTLGVLWHPIEKKGQDFAFSVKYVGFLWDLDRRRVSLPDRKRVKLLAKISSFMALSSSLITRRDCASLHGSLQHVTFIYRHGRSTLPPLSVFVAKFPNDFSKRHVPASVIDSVRWWGTVLSTREVPAPLLHDVESTLTSGWTRLHPGGSVSWWVIAGLHGIFMEPGRRVTETLDGRNLWLWSWLFYG